MRNMVPDTLFPSDNNQGIPVLDTAQECKLVDMPLTAWGSVSRASKMLGTWHFYTDDYRFSALWGKPDDVVNTGCVSAVEVNYSITSQMPYPVALYRIYQKRWLSRYWQSQGIRIIADLNVARPFRELNMLGIPAGWKSYATHGYNERLEQLEEEYKAAVKRAGTNSIYFLVYGGGQLVKDYCNTNPRITHIDEYRNMVKAK